jgi:hypothetical protein
MEADYEGIVLMPSDFIDTDMGVMKVDIIQFPKKVILSSAVPTRTTNELIAGSLIARDGVFILKYN